MLSIIKNFIRNEVQSILEENQADVQEKPVQVPKECGTIVQIKRSKVSDTPSTLSYGELAFSFKSNTLYIGDENDKPFVIVTKVE